MFCVVRVWRRGSERTGAGLIPRGPPDGLCVVDRSRLAQRNHGYLHTFTPSQVLECSSSRPRTRHEPVLQMKATANLIANFKPTTFKTYFSYTYITFLPHYIASDPQHPLCILQRRELKARKREGLWWHVTTGVELSRSSVVRSWCRRRLRNAFAEALKKNGFDEYGRLVNPQLFVRDRSQVAHAIQSNTNLSLTGSLRLHILPPLIASKYPLVCKEADGIIDILLDGFENKLRSVHPPTQPAFQQSSPILSLSSTLPNTNRQPTVAGTASMSQQDSRTKTSRRQPAPLETGQPSDTSSSKGRNQQTNPQPSAPHERVAIRRSQGHGTSSPTDPRKPNGPPSRHRVVTRRA